MHFLTLKPSINWFSSLDIGKVSSALPFFAISLARGSHWSPLLLISLRIYHHLSSNLVPCQESKNLSNDYWISFLSKNCFSNWNDQYLETSTFAVLWGVMPLTHSSSWRITLWACQIWIKTRKFITEPSVFKSVNIYNKFLVRHKVWSRK